ncbi:MAG: leucine-rich repeat domain-containing protein [Flavobacteriales bacterium]|nr:leucine-rich repeat domain-containing protein [Flavobacteriales bacterium]
MIKKKAYKFWISISLLIMALPGYSQLLDSAAFDTVPTYTLQQALKKDPLNVYKLKLKKLQLKEVPEEIYQFKNLNALDLSKNKLKEFPPRLAEFKYLQELDLSVNKIEIIPKELGQLVHLKEFRANQNEIVSLPPEIKYLVELRFMDLWGNNIGSLPSEIVFLKNTLKEIDMRVILMSDSEHKKIQELLPDTKIKFSKSCNCGF